MTRQAGLSKSRITLFEQCPKRLWLSVHRPELADEQPDMQRGFAEGHRVGELACSLVPGGVMVSAEGGMGRAVEQTSSLLAQGHDRPIFEATFAHDGVLVRVDILEPVEGGWHMAEVKNTTGVKDYHIGDLATQLWVMRNAGVEVRSSAIRHVDRDFTLEREGDYAGLFTDTRVDERVATIMETRAEVVAEARAVLASDEPPIERGDHCISPFTCSFIGWCSRNEPEAPEWPVDILPDAAGKKVAAKLKTGGIADLTQVPADEMPSPKLSRIHHATVTGEVWHEAEAIRAATAGWAWPRTYLDFETIAPSIPRWLGTRPFQQVPFQFSAHIENADGTMTHSEFLSLDGGDPRRACAEALARLPQEGAVIAWNMAFERSCILGLARHCPDLARVLESLADRLVDLLPLARRHYYHRDMRGSWSIKAVLPTLADIGYADLVEVKSGTDAQAGYLEATDPATSRERRGAIRDALLDYCRRDTEAMVLVLTALTRERG
ncbi:DUF2779 domain-containing protein [Alteraurantiacibacter buctensis]|uniref:DUF2779 domain-containing protein n=1 Tax=Alteraurantiacibacter buctensis TaxID=1503981 RepID=A0A844YT98_9SPHN|nr:DUF2779 domain-containing protein [Alteraurantiacibacter buctensis]MXO70280.1 DUF2779 domain-containing protein [Alteraurantiacibacter buctensis]